MHVLARAKVCKVHIGEDCLKLELIVNQCIQTAAIISNWVELRENWVAFSQLNIACLMVLHDKQKSLYKLKNDEAKFN